MNTEIEQITSGKEALELSIKMLHKECLEIVDTYWKEIIKMEKDHNGWTNKSRLNLRCALKGNSIRAEWTGIKWSGKNKSGKFTDNYQSIPKPPGNYRYALTKLFKYAHPWEMPLIEETEEKLEAIRRQSFHLNSALKSLRYAIEIATKREETTEQANQYQHTAKLYQ